MEESNVGWWGEDTPYRLTSFLPVVNINMFIHRLCFDLYFRSDFFH